MFGKQPSLELFPARPYMAVRSAARAMPFKASRKHAASPSATIERKPRQGRKAATVSFDSGAGVTLAGLPPFHVWQAAVPGTLSRPAIRGRALSGARDAI